jgi:hypothetical protein
MNAMHGLLFPARFFPAIIKRYFALGAGFLSPA